MIENALRTFLLSTPAVANLLGTKGIHVGDCIINASEQLPAIGIECDPTSRITLLDGSTPDFQLPMFEIRAKSQLFDTSSSLMDAILTALESLSLGGTVEIMVDGASVPITIEQVDLLTSPFNDPEENYGHAITVKSRVVKIRVGWREITTL